MSNHKYTCHDSSFIDENVEVGSNTKIWHFSHILNNTVIGKNCSIGQNVVIGPNVKVGDGCKIQNNISIYDGVVIEDDVFLGPSCVFTNVINPRAFIERKDEFKITTVKKGASIGANATIICGVTIGKYSIIGAGSVVTKDVEPYTVVIGNPAKYYSRTSKEGDILDINLVCKKTGKSFVLKGDEIIKND
jgi:UDP-2-acetamido-3-amino-2,3-dideoxy-glucuronate N-acetyltransferase